MFTRRQVTPTFPQPQQPPRVLEWAWQKRYFCSSTRRLLLISTIPLAWLSISKHRGRHWLTLELPDITVALGVDDVAFTNVADTVTSNIDPSKFVAVTTAAAVAGSVLLAYSVVFPNIVTLPIVVMFLVIVNVLLTASLSELISNSILWMLDWYCEGTAVRKGAGVSAVRADCTRELMSPEVIEATDEAADWMATPRPTWMLEGTFWETMVWAAELNWSLLVLGLILVCGSNLGRAIRHG